MAQNEGKRTILVVEDDPAIRHLIVRILHRGGLETLSAGKAETGLLLVREHRDSLDLAIIDIVMPGMSGLDLATDLDREFPDLKILYISGYVHSIAADVLSRRSPDRMLLKPFGGKVLLERVNLLLPSNARRGPGKVTNPLDPGLQNGTLG
jgi:DNA-binding response OmpR family regulator